MSFDRGNYFWNTLGLEAFCGNRSDIVVGNVAVDDLAMLGAEASASHIYGPKPYV